MICFRDKTFCDFYKECQDGKDCDRALTFGVRVKAWLWWNTGRTVGAQEPPITTYIEKPDCFKENNMIKVKFVGIDTLNRPVFKDIEHEDYYVSGINFFICNECEENVLEYVHSRELEYIGHSFEGSQYGIEPRQKIQIIKVNN